LIKLLKPS